MARFEYVNDTIQELYVQTDTIANDSIKEVRVLRQHPTSPVVAIGGWTASATSLGFSGLTGTIPPAGVFLCGTEKIQYGAITWTSATAGTFTSCKRGWESTTAAIHNAGAAVYFGDAFSWIATNVLINATTIPFISLDRPVAQIPETGIVFIEDEWVWYGGVTYTNAAKTAGNLLYCFRGYNGTTAAAHNGSVTNIAVRFEHIFKEREYVALYNYASGSTYRVYYGFNPTISNTGTNALPLDWLDDVTIPLGCRNRIYAIIDSGGARTGTLAIAEWR